MLRELDRQYDIIHIAGREYRIRFDLNAMLCLETVYRPIEELFDPRQWSERDIIELTRAALCALDENYPAVKRRDFFGIRPDERELRELIRIEDLNTLRLELARAVAHAYPEQSERTAGSEAQEGKRYYSGIGHTKAIFCDEMGNSDELFWSSTYRELDSRIGFWLEAKGLKERPVVVRKYDDD